MAELVGIYIAEKKAGEPLPVSEIRAIPGHGLEGDRYCKRQGTFSKPGKVDREVTLVEAEAVEALASRLRCPHQRGRDPPQSGHTRHRAEPFGRQGVPGGRGEASRDPGSANRAATWRN